MTSFLCNDAVVFYLSLLGYSCIILSHFSALLAAAAPEMAPFMADECLMAIPEIEGIDYTTKEYLNFVSHIQGAAERLNKETQSAASE